MEISEFSFSEFSEFSEFSDFVPGEAMEGGRARGPRVWMFSCIMFMESAGLGSSPAALSRFLLSPFVGTQTLGTHQEHKNLQRTAADESIQVLVSCSCMIPIAC